MEDKKDLSAGAQAHFDKEREGAVRPFEDHEMRLLSKIGKNASASLPCYEERVKRMTNSLKMVTFVI